MFVPKLVTAGSNSAFGVGKTIKFFIARKIVASNQIFHGIEYFDYQKNVWVRAKPAYAIVPYHALLLLHGSSCCGEFRLGNHRRQRPTCARQRRQLAHTGARQSRRHRSQLRAIIVMDVIPRLAKASVVNFVAIGEPLGGPFMADSRLTDRLFVASDLGATDAITGGTQ